MNSSAAFAKWAPRLYGYENQYLTNIIAHDQELRQQGRHPKPEARELCRNFPHTPWAAGTFNCGPQTVCTVHVDSKNLPLGWCALTALGNFDHKKGGHLVLWEPGHVIEFPAGSTILIPSGAVHHSNASIEPHEKRQSFTQYSARALFTYIDNGYQTREDYMAELTRKLGKKGARALVSQKESRQLTDGLALYSTMSELSLLN